MSGRALHGNNEQLGAASLRSHNQCDKNFIEMVDEIQREYIKFSKPERIRIERWIEKLVAVVSVNCFRDQTDFAGSLQWRRERNLYTKNLLDGVIKRSLREPFHVLPPDGPLMQLPSHIRHCSKSDLVGVHELSFWRDLRSSVNNGVPLAGNESIIAPSDGGVTPSKTSIIGLTPSKTPRHGDASSSSAVHSARGVASGSKHPLNYSHHKHRGSGGGSPAPHHHHSHAPPPPTFQGQGGPVSPRDLLALKDIIREQSDHIHMLEQRIAQQQQEHGQTQLQLEQLLASQAPRRRAMYSANSPERESRPRRVGSPSSVDAFLQYLEDFQTDTKSMLRLENV